LDPELKKTDELLLKLSADEDTFRLYEAREYALIERNSMIAGGIQKGKEIGIEIGKELGIEIGIDKGIELRNRELAKRFSTDGYDIEQIAKLLFMTKDDVIQLMKQSN
jgi:predicted transposase YdaD